MGREIKRVAINFEWELNKVWVGFLNPYYDYSRKCSFCDGSGLSKEAKQLSDQWYGYAEFHPSNTGSIPLTPDSNPVKSFVDRQGYIPSFAQSECRRLSSMWNKQWAHHLEQADIDALLDRNRLFYFTRNDIVPTVEQVNEWSIITMGHDSINQYICVKAKCERLGYPHFCQSCNGDGDVFEAGYRYLSEQWEQIEPPIGEGWQLWETVSEGSPISPVFKDEFEFEEYLLSEGYSVGAIQNFIKAGFAFSMTVDTLTGDVKQNIETLAIKSDDEPL